jgi:hypothetical protein
MFQVCKDTRSKDGNVFFYRLYYFKTRNILIQLASIYRKFI